jgi:DNA-binding HxlR family transcriptional regulator
MRKSKKVIDKTVNCSRSRCPVACTLDLLGDKWTLLLVRDLLLGKSTYSEFQQSPEGIPSNILAERLKRLTVHGVAEKVLYQQHPRRYRYRLTAKGRDLYPVLSAMIDWGNRHVPGTLTRKEIEAQLERV